MQIIITMKVLLLSKIIVAAYDEDQLAGCLKEFEKLFLSGTQESSDHTQAII